MIDRPRAAKFPAKPEPATDFGTMNQSNIYVWVLYPIESTCMVSLEACWVWPVSKSFANISRLLFFKLTKSSTPHLPHLVEFKRTQSLCGPEKFRHVKFNKSPGHTSLCWRGHCLPLRALSVCNCPLVSKKASEKMPKSIRTSGLPDVSRCLQLFPDASRCLSSIVCWPKIHWNITETTPDVRQRRSLLEPENWTWQWRPWPVCFPPEPCHFYTSQEMSHFSRVRFTPAPVLRSKTPWLSWMKDIYIYCMCMYMCMYVYIYMRSKFMSLWHRSHRTWLKTHFRLLSLDFNVL